jgi:hypothetical protein
MISREARNLARIGHPLRVTEAIQGWTILIDNFRGGLPVLSAPGRRSSLKCPLAIRGHFFLMIVRHEYKGSRLPRGWRNRK